MHFPNRLFTALLALSLVCAPIAFRARANEPCTNPVLASAQRQLLDRQQTLLALIQKTDPLIEKYENETTLHTHHKKLWDAGTFTVSALAFGALVAVGAAVIGVGTAGATMAGGTAAGATATAGVASTVATNMATSAASGVASSAASSVVSTVASSVSAPSVVNRLGSSGLGVVNTAVSVSNSGGAVPRVDYIEIQKAARSLAVDADHPIDPHAELVRVLMVSAKEKTGPEIFDRLQRLQTAYDFAHRVTSDLFSSEITRQAKEMLGEYEVQTHRPSWWRKLPGFKMGFKEGQKADHASLLAGLQEAHRSLYISEHKDLSDALAAIAERCVMDAEENAEGRRPAVDSRLGNPKADAALKLKDAAEKRTRAITGKAAGAP